jgi:DmsE family decaheme c-type cytochrome
MTALPVWLRPRLLCPLLSVALLVGLVVWSLASENIAASEQAPSQLTSEHVAAMRAELAAIHRGKVSAAALARIAGAQDALAEMHRGKVDTQALKRIEAMSTEKPSDAGGLIQTAFDAGDIAAEMSSYIAHTAGQPIDDTSPVGKRMAEVAVADAPAQPESNPTEKAASRTYVGQKVCENCHVQEAANWAHTIHAAVFTLNPGDTSETHGCEACHGPGSAHVANPSDLSTIISFSHKSLTPVPVQNAQCLSCHQGGPRIFWHGSIHDSNKLACSDCHNPMSNFAAHGLTARESVNETCFSCHKVQRAQFNMRSHMPLPEGKISCVDCHNPHGSTTDPLLKAESVNDVCYSCHADKRGPFLFEHAPVRENCLNCHNPHGSNFESLLTAPRPMLCQQCHAQVGHPAQLLTRGNLAMGPIPDPRLISTSCQTCHVNIHGSNDPSGARFER